MTGVMMGNEFQMIVEYAPLVVGMLMVAVSWI